MVLNDVMIIWDFLSVRGSLIWRIIWEKLVPLPDRTKNQTHLSGTSIIYIILLLSVVYYRYFVSMITLVLTEQLHEQSGDD